MAVEIKICGLKTPDALDACIACGADMAGFVFYERSPRHILLSLAHALGVQAGGRIQRVALLVDADDASISPIIEALRPDVLQLHGNETTARVNQIKARFGLPVMRVFGISRKADVNDAIAQAGDIDRVLFDAKPASAAALPGGNGEAFDWTLLAELALAQPWLLSGGLNAQNVGAALRASHAPGVDVSSGVESAIGVKNADMISDFIAAARIG